MRMLVRLFVAVMLLLLPSCLHGILRGPHCSCVPADKDRLTYAKMLKRIDERLVELEKAEAAPLVFHGGSVPVYGAPISEDFEVISTPVYASHTPGVLIMDGCDKEEVQDDSDER